MLDPIQWIQQLYQQQKDRDVNGVAAASWLTHVGKTDGVEFVPVAAGFDQSNKGIKAILQAIAASTGNNEYFHNMQGNLISWLQTLNQRTYDRFLQLDERTYEERLRDEQRGFDSPSALVGRLMAAGMSREAALAAVQGSVGGGSASAIGASSPLQSGLPNNQAHGDNSAQFANYMQGVSGLLDSISSLAQVGISAPSAIASGSLHSAQAVAQKYQNDAQVGSAKLQGIFHRAERLGVIKPSEMSFDESIAACESLPASTDQQIYDYFHNDDGYDMLIGSPLGYSTATANYSARYDSDQKFRNIQHTQALIRCANLQAEDFAFKWDKNNAEIQRIFAEIDSIQATNEREDLLANSQLLLNSAEADNLHESTLLQQAERNYKIADTGRIEAERDMAKIAAHRMGITADTYDAIAMTEAQGLLQRAVASNDPKVIDAACATIINNAKYRSQIAYFNAVRASDLNELRKSDPQLYESVCRWSMFYNEANIGSLFETYINNSTTQRGKYLPESYRTDYSNFMRTFGIDIH